MWYPYLEYSKTLEDTLSIEDLADLPFKYGNEIDFWIVALAAMKTKETPTENIMCWVKNNSEDGWYKDLQTVALMLILKYIILVIGLLGQ